MKLTADRGLGDLGRLAGDAAAFDIRRHRNRSAAAPVYEETLRMEVQRLTPDIVTRVVQAGRDQIQYCYARATAGGKAPTGAVTVHFVVEPRGHVSEVSVVAGGAHARRLERCMERHIRRWQFPAADAETTVDYPFVFDVAD